MIYHLDHPRFYHYYLLIPISLKTAPCNNAPAVSNNNTSFISAKKKTHDNSLASFLIVVIIIKLI